MIERLAAPYELKLLGTQPKAHFEAFARLAQRIFGAPLVLVSLMDADGQRSQRAAAMR
jgi:hypothetical protein